MTKVLEHFPAKWAPARCKKIRQSNKLVLRFKQSITALVAFHFAGSPPYPLERGIPYRCFGEVLNVRFETLERRSGSIGSKSSLTAPCARDAGYTLLELMVVLAILSLAAALVLPRIGAGGESAALRSAALQLAAGLRATRTEAMSAAQETSLILDVAQRRYWADGAVKARSLPNGIAMVTGHSPGKPIAADRAVVLFRPDGSASGGWIGLQSKTQTAGITVDWLTGATRIDWAR